MNVRELEAFRAVMIVGTTTAAAKLLQLSQPTVSKLIASFERRNDLQLFEREKGRLTPRPEAIALFHHVDKLFVAVDEVTQNARQLANAQTGHLRLASFGTLAHNFLPQAISSFLYYKPGAIITLDILPSASVVELISRQQADIGFTSGTPAGAGMVTEPFEPSDSVCVLPVGHQLAALDEITAVDLRGERFISLGLDTALRHLIDGVFAAELINRSVVVETEDSLTACTLVAHGAGVTICDPLAALARFERGDVVLRRFSPHLAFTMQAVFPLAATRSQLATEFLSHLVGLKQDVDRRIAAALNRTNKTESAEAQN